MNFLLDYPVNKPLYISIITTQPSPTHPSPPSEMRVKVWTVKRVFISTNCSYFIDNSKPIDFYFGPHMFAWTKPLCADVINRSPHWGRGMDGTAGKASSRRSRRRRPKRERHLFRKLNSSGIFLSHSCSGRLLCV